MYMFNENLLSEKLKYLILMNAKQQMFNVMNINIEFEYIDQNHSKLHRYDVDIKFDYEGALDFGFEEFMVDFQRMSKRLEKVLSEYVITKEGKIVESSKSNCYILDPLVFKIEYEADTTHIFELGYKFQYDDEE